MATIATDIYQIAAQLGQSSAPGRLIPSPLMVPNEIIQTYPVLLPSWLADCGGTGITDTALEAASTLCEQESCRLPLAGKDPASRCL